MAQTPKPFQGFALPFKENARGGVALVKDGSGEESKVQTDKLIRTALFDNESSNPFQDLANPEDMIFSIKQRNSPEIARVYVEEALAGFEDRIVVNEIVSVPVADNEIGVEISYTYVLTETRERITVKGP